LLTGDSPLRAVNASPRFKVGETVRVKNPITLDHTRLPGYLRTRTGIVHEAYEGAYAYFCSTGPDGIGDPMPVYCVRFDPQDIWGALADPNTYVYADLFEAYLETA
jgi:nitrile hydratase